MQVLLLFSETNEPAASWAAGAAVQSAATGAAGAQRLQLPQVQVLSLGPIKALAEMQVLLLFSETNEPAASWAAGAAVQSAATGAAGAQRLQLPQVQVLSLGPSEYLSRYSDFLLPICKSLCFIARKHATFH